jgi:acyl dehydratase
MMPMADDTTVQHRMVYGSYADALAMIGHEAPPSVGNIKVSEALVQLYCGISEDRNPSYWDETFATAQWGSLVAPPGMLFTWTLPLAWTPQHSERPLPLCISVPLPGDTVVNAQQESEFFEPIRIGDRLTMRERVHAVSPPKESHLGLGHYVTTKAQFVRQDGTVVAELTNSVFRYTARKGPTA